MVLICHVLSGTPDIITRAQYALEVKTQVLPIYEQIFDIEYPLPKLDTLVVRHMFVFETSRVNDLKAHDFDAGAMENWVTTSSHWYHSGPYEISRGLSLDVQARFLWIQIAPIWR